MRNTKKHFPLSYKLFYTFIISFIIPILLTCILISYLFVTYQYQGIKEQALDNAMLITTYLEKYMYDIDHIMRVPYYSSYFQSKKNVKELTLSDQNNIISEIGQTLRLTTYSRDDFEDFLILSDKEVLYFDSNNYYEYLPTSTPLPHRNWYIAALEKDGKIAIVPNHMPSSDEEEIATMSFFISRKLNNLYKPEQENIMMINMKNSALTELFSEIYTDIPSIILFTNDNEELIYSNSHIEKNFLKKLTKQTVSHDNRMWVHTSETLENYPLTVHVLLSTSYISEQILAFVLISLFFCVIGILIAYILFNKNNKWIRLPVLHIQSTLKEMKEGNLNSRCLPQPIDEFNIIGTSINTMAERMQEKIKNEYELLISQKTLQFQALQSQIQPHFIINTIYSFITLNQIGETELLNDAFYSFANLLRYVLSRQNTTTIGKEFDFLQNYCMLHHLRFGNRISYHIECNEALRDIDIPKLLLQPLVENAVIHGIEPSETPCTLLITAEEHHGNIYIVIEDNGIGFTKEQLNSPNSIGIKNVENRIKIWNEQVQFFIYRIEHSSIQIIQIPKNIQGASCIIQI